MQKYIVEISDTGTIRWLAFETKALHRTDGPAIEYADGYKAWYIDGKLHRIDGPAIEFPDGDKEWWFEGKLHKVDGPAIECKDGYKAWYIDGTQYTEEEFNKKVNSCEGKTVEIDGKKYKLTLCE